MKRKTTRTFFHLLAITSFMLFLVGFILAVWDLMYPPKTVAFQSKKTEQPISSEEGLLLGLGDSQTRGIGDSKGLGYFGMVRNQLSKVTHGKSSAVNLAISGQTSNDLLKQMKQDKVLLMVQKAKWISITIGGNDLFRGSGGLEKINLEAAEKSRQQYEKNLKEILTLIYKQNPKALVFIFGLYNPFGDLDLKETSSSLVSQWNETIQKVTSKFDNAIIIPTFDLFQLNPSKYLYTDHFHPNEIGYERMATRLLQVLLDQVAEGGGK
ncbi:GDSL-type esterase/lipase family protein [Thermoflavimicrobium daqui]|uniref:SGNH hydrolase-type esterase domain-containing protein n=1 Tax=Thermoflavimicrobium daqui TaxID=2137476 RepID=A0A364K8L1_9BACL|nr:GDSL-type esterase/lipase family protein [Thermoflavimicrobium daqui]RAL26635.1 hypothetical protein DL897_00880 [Thermoflavimicrobium daqui]